ncbi:hypothetical protein [Marichromatium gracile]|uniref:Uncharacterized protein n=1 Tax=Marichromatium gracile TaxID=1048 RepID=A0A4R4A4T8_MARGR|nr:hypothetical protein [Marichromatium gracile]MBK1709823.1 hypothetical protein [Marichromatium gracile]TCW32666.1 hypothetical protein EDC29_11732 [Marichromatium gracile]
MTESQLAATGIAWFRPEDYDRCRQLFVDGHKLPETYEEWHQAAQRIHDKLTAEGHRIERAYIDPKTFPAWCAARGLNVDAKARMQFASWVARVEHGKG